MTRLLYILAGVGGAMCICGVGLLLLWASTSMFGVRGFQALMALFVATIGGMCGYVIYLNRRP